MSDAEIRDFVRVRIEQVLDILAHVSFGNFDVPVPVLPDGDNFAELFTGLEILVADLREAQGDLQAQVCERTEALEEDVRQRKQVEARLRASEATYRMLVETSPDPILLCDLDGRVRMANPALLRALRLDSTADILGIPLLDFVVTEDRARAAEHMSGPRAGVAAGEAEFRLRRRDGAEFIGELHASAVHDGASGAAGVLWVIHDVTLQRQREREQLRAQQLESLGTLAGGIAHDFNNCLTAIIGCLMLAKDRIKHVPEARELLEDASDAAFRATSLTRQLLTFSKGGVPLKTCLHVGGLVERATDFCLRGSNVKGDVRIDADLWSVEVDTGQLEQVLGNLVINAKQAMPDGGTIVVRASNVVVAQPNSLDGERRYVRISVEDSGVGIPAENLPRIYDPYFSTKAGGSGLGLATAYSVVRKHGGFIDCNSTVGQGSTFQIHLPASDHRCDVIAPSPPMSHGGHGRILVMDDDDLVREVAERQLRGAGYEVKGVASGTAARRAYREAMAQGRPFDLVLMDLTVPGGDGGKETMPKLLDIDPGAKGIVVSGYSDDPVLANYENYGFLARLAKPYRMEQLLRAVAAVANKDRKAP
jgi:two-component system, cell cycle sensor histidine kinase and response regulator CckA